MAAEHSTPHAGRLASLLSEQRVDDDVGSICGGAECARRTQNTRGSPQCKRHTIPRRACVKIWCAPHSLLRTPPPLAEATGVNCYRDADYDGADDERRRKSKDDVQHVHEYSLRAYLEVLYYADANVAPAMHITLRGVVVPPRNWSTFLMSWPANLAPCAPQGSMSS